MNVRIDRCDKQHAGKSRSAHADRLTANYVTRFFLIVALASVILSSERCYAEWPFPRGDAQASGVAATGLPENLAQLWRFRSTGSGFEATAAIADGTVYVGDVDGTFYAIQIGDGDLLWQKKFENSGFLAGAAVVEKRIYVGDFNGLIRCLDAASGDVIWTYQARGEVYAAPNVVGQRVLVTTESGELLCLSKQDGNELWKFEIDAPLRCWPMIVGNRVLLAGCDSRLHAVEIDSGKEVGGIDLDGPTGATPALWDDSVFFGTESGTFYRLTPSDILWQTHDADRKQPIRTSAAVDQRAVVFGSQGKRVVALDPSNGKPIWAIPARSAVESSPIIAGNLVFVATKRGRLIALDLATGKERWQFDAGGNFQASPAVADGKLVLGNTDGILYCFGEPTTADD